MYIYICIYIYIYVVSRSSALATLSKFLDRMIRTLALTSGQFRALGCMNLGFRVSAHGCPEGSKGP